MGDHAQPQADFIGPEPMTALPRHFHCLLAFFAPLFRCSPLVVEPHNRPARKRQAVSGPGFYGARPRATKDAKPLPALLPEVVPGNEINEIRGDTRDIAGKAVGVHGRDLNEAAGKLDAYLETKNGVSSGQVGQSAQVNVNQPSHLIN